eukprot:gnl/TRDRNA2_/TRDRNA2_153299_c0_seq10.p1 gnl/TRDRNA2_/TRDRNA2_153299_c0~~gnl/TRDRNA2_/TRDRNA2_153299_c0_seq10.p1  ORF type:complete len:587 (-),score=36.50 gnl/TRDRNA2_/TRDRNA2_153299_c0_seq10:12-1589(-)
MAASNDSSTVSPPTRTKQSDSLEALQAQSGIRSEDAQRGATRHHHQAQTEVRLRPTPTELRRVTIASCIISTLAALASIAAWRWWSRTKDEAGARQIAEKQSKDRMYLLDNVKVVGSFLVLYGHLCYFNDFHAAESKTWLAGADLAIVNCWFSPIKMPTICFVSGVCSQSPINPARFRRYLQGLVVPWILISRFALPLLHALVDQRIKSGTWDWDDLLMHLRAIVTLQNHGNIWYLEALICWRAIAFFIWSYLPPPVVFVSSLMASCAAGYVEITCPGGLLTLNHMFGFIGYFMMGYILPFQYMCSRAERLEDSVVERLSFWAPQHVAAVGFRAAAAAALLVMLTVFNSQKFMGGSLIVSDGHGKYGATWQDGFLWDMQRLDYYLFWTHRLATIAMDTSAMLIMVFFLCPRRQMSLTWCGSYTLYNYILHPTLLVIREKLFCLLPLPVIYATPGHILVLLLYIPLCLFLLFICCCRITRFFFSWAFEPVWLNPVMDYLFSSSVATKAGEGEVAAGNATSHKADRS